MKNRGRIDLTELERAREYWSKLMRTFGNPKGSESVLKDLLKRYTEPHRIYHKLSHILLMLDGLESIKARRGYEPEVALAIWFHDAIYDTRAKDNEKRSAMLAKKMIKKMGLPNLLGREVSKLVMATEHPSHVFEYSSQVIHDLDLMVLGGSREEFEVYEAGIREEYSWVPEDQFRSARLRILRSFLSKTFIYYIWSIRHKYQANARRNLKMSVAHLEKR